MRYTCYADNYSGNSMKTPYNYIFVEGNKMEASQLFKKHFGFSPCLRTKSDMPDGPGYHARDYHIEETDDIVKFTQYMRRCKFDHEKLEFEEAPGCENYKTFDEYVKSDGHSFEKAKFIVKDGAW